jgi:hypothetical protein
MKFESPQSNITTNPTTQIEEMSTAEKVAIAKLESDLKSLEPNESLPEINLESFGAIGKAKVTGVIMKVVDFYFKKRTAAGLIIIAKLFKLVQQNGINLSSEEITAPEVLLEEEIEIIFKKCLDDSNLLKDACMMQEFFHDYEKGFIEICEEKRELLKKYVCESEDFDYAKYAFKLLPSIENDEDLKEKVEDRLKRLLAGKDVDIWKVQEFFKVYAKDFFTSEERHHAAIVVLEKELSYVLKSGRDFKAGQFIEVFHLTDEEREIIISKVLDDNLANCNFRTVQCLAKWFGVEEELQLKASKLYIKKLTEENQNGDDVEKLDSIVSEEFKAQEDIINLKRTWALNNLGKNRVLDSHRDGAIDDFKKRFALTNEFLTNHESQQKIQEKLLYILSYGNYRNAISVYEEFITEESKTDNFRKQIETTFLSAIEKNNFHLRKGASSEKLLDILSEDFKRSPEFRCQAIKILSYTMHWGETEDISFTIEKLGCSEDEIKKAKVGELLNFFLYGDIDKEHLKSSNNRSDKEIKGVLLKIAPDEEILDIVRTQLSEVVLRNANFSELKALRFYADFLGIPDSQIIEQEKYKEIVYRDIETNIRNGELNNAVDIAKRFKLTSEDCKNVDINVVKEGVIWWLSESEKTLGSYKGLEFAKADIGSFIKFFNLSEESIFQNPQIRKIGGRLFLAGQVFYNLRSDTIEIFSKTLLITEEDMISEVDGVLDLIINKEIDKWEHFLKRMTSILPGLPEGFADHSISKKYLSEMTSYSITRNNSYERNRNDICDHLIKNMNIMKTFEAQQEICTRTFEYIVSEGKFDAALHLLVERKAFSFVKQEVRQECLLPEYIRILTEIGEYQATNFSNSFKLDVTNISDERVVEAHQSMFKTELSNKNISGMINYFKKAKFSDEFLNTTEIKVAIENAFIENFTQYGLRDAMKLVENGLLNNDFIRSERVQESAKSHISKLLSDSRFGDIVTLNSQLTLGVTSRDIILLDHEKLEFFERLNTKFPRLAKKCLGSIEALFSIWPHTHLLTGEVLEKFPFLVEALEENDKFGVKLLLKFQSLDKLSQTNIQTLYKNKAQILNEKSDIDVESRDFRINMQDRLTDYRRNTEIIETLKKSGINVEEWLNHEEEVFFTLGRDENLKFSDTIVTPIERIQETIDSYTDTVKDVLEQYKKELMNFRVPLKDASLLGGELEKLKTQKQIAEQNGDTKKSEGIAKGISSIEDQILNIKDIPLWDKVFSSISLLDLIKKDIFKAYDDLRIAEAELDKKETDNDIPINQKRKDLIKLKNKINSAKKEMREKVQLLGVRLADFDNDLFTMIAPALGEDRTESIIQEKNESAQEHLDHYNSDSKTLENLFYEKEDTGLVGQHMKIGVWNRNPDKDLYLGNYTDCCIRIDSSHMGAECTIADYLTDVGVQIVSIVDEKKNIPVVAAWCWIGHDDNDQVAFVIDNIEANTEYSANYRAQLESKLQEYLQNYSKKVGVKLVQGTSNNDLVVSSMDSSYYKLGGYNRPSGYFLEGENSGITNDEADEHEHEHWGENDGEGDFNEE